MSSVLIVGPRDFFLEKVLESLSSEGLTIVSNTDAVLGVDYILYSTLDAELGNFARHIHKLREGALENKARFIVIALDSKRTRDELQRTNEKIDERHVYLSSNNPLFSEELWKDLKRLVFSPSSRNSSIHLKVVEGEISRTQESGLEPRKQEVVNKQADLKKYPTEVKEKVRKSKRTWTPLFLITFLIIFLLFIPFIELKAGEQLLRYRDADKTSLVAENLLSGAFNGFSFYKEIPYFGRVFTSSEKRARQLLSFARILKSHQKALGEAKGLVAGFFSYDEPLLPERIIDSKREFEKISNELDLLAAETGIESSTLGIEELRKKAKGMRSLLGYLQETGDSREASDLLILLTDASEMRGSGGVIAGYGLLRFQAGKVESFQTFLSEEIDSKLKGEVVPPTLLKTYLKQEAWYFKDSAWSPDFESASAKGAWFLEKTTGKKVDGVVSVDTEFLREFGRAQGEVVGDFYNLIQSAGESFILEKADAVYESLTRDPKQGLETLSNVIFKSLEEKHVLVDVGSSSYSDTIRELGWGGTIREDSCLDTEQCMDDYLQIVSANLNGSRQGFRVLKDYKLEIKIGKESVQHKLTIQRDGAAGDLKEYLRIYTPQSSEMVEPILLNSETGAQEKIKTDKALESGRTVYGFVVEVTKGQKTEIILNWSTDLLQGANLTQYNLVWQKQAGANEGAALLNIQYADKTTPQYFLTPRGRALTRRGSLLYNTQLTQDMTLRLLFEK